MSTIKTFFGLAVHKKKNFVINGIVVTIIRDRGVKIPIISIWGLGYSGSHTFVLNGDNFSTARRIHA